MDYYMSLIMFGDQFYGDPKCQIKQIIIRKDCAYMEIRREWRINESKDFKKKEITKFRFLFMPVATMTNTNEMINYLNNNLSNNNNKNKNRKKLNIKSVWFFASLLDYNKIVKLEDKQNSIDVTD